MTSQYEEKKAALLAALSQHQAVKDFQRAEKALLSRPDLEGLVRQMKTYQQEAVLFEKIDKPQAQKASAQSADQMAQDLNALPLVQDYRQKMQDASDLIHYVTKSIEEKINEELTDGK